MTVVTFPGSIVIRAVGEIDQPGADQPDWGVYADSCWDGWPGVVLDWPDFGLPANAAAAIAAISEGFARARKGQDVLVGCRGGTGRTGTVLACMAILAGLPTDLAVPWVRARYRTEAVEIHAQIEWITGTFAVADLVRKQAQESKARFIKATEGRIRKVMREALAEPERSPVLAWVVPGVLAVTQRPLRAHPMFGGSGRRYPPDARPAIGEWISRLMEQGVRSVVVLTSHKELAHYSAATAPDGGLLALYAGQGLRVAHFPADDPANDVTARHAFDAAVGELAGRVAESLAQLPLPAVIHCSAAIDRSPPVAARIAFLAEVGALSHGTSASDSS